MHICVVNMYICVLYTCVYIYIRLSPFPVIITKGFTLYILVGDPYPHLPLLLGRGRTPYIYIYIHVYSVCRVIKSI